MTDSAHSNPYAPPVAGPASDPYAPPKAPAAPSGIDPEHAEAIRREHLSHEASIRAIGTLYSIGGIVYLAVAAIMAIVFFGGLASGGDPLNNPVSVVVALVLVGLIGWAQLWMGRGLRNLDDKVKLAVTIFAVIGLLGFPVGTLLSIYVLYLVHSEKGKRVLSAEYRAIRDRTPHLRYKTPLWLWIIVGLLAVGLIALVFLAMLQA